MSMRVITEKESLSLNNRVFGFVNSVFGQSMHSGLSATVRD